MRKLLMIGSILIMGLTAFAGVDTDLKLTGDKYSGEVSMKVGSTGIASDGVNGGKLIVTPLINGGTSGSTLKFDFNDLVRGRTEKAMASFKAEVVNEAGKLATLTDKTTVKLQTVKLADGGEQTITDKGNKVTGIELKQNIAKNPQKLGELSYEITSNRVNNSGKTLEVDIVSTVEIADMEHTGNFVDDSIRVSIAVKDLETPEWN